MAKQKKYLFIILFFITSSIFACDPIPLPNCPKIKDQLRPFHKKSWKVFKEKLEQLENAIDSAILVAEKTKSRPSNSCFNQHLYKLRLIDTQIMATNFDGKTCLAHIDFFKNRFNPRNSPEIKFAFKSNIPKTIKSMIQEVEDARQVFVQNHQ